MKNRYVVVLLFSSALSFLLMVDAAFATREARPIRVDHRVRTVMFQPDQVFKFVGHYGFQSTIEFDEDESIETISMGDTD